MTYQGTDSASGGTGTTAATAENGSTPNGASMATQHAVHLSSQSHSHLKSKAGVATRPRSKANGSAANGKTNKSNPKNRSDTPHIELRLGLHDYTIYRGIEKDECGYSPMTSNSTGTYETPIEAAMAYDRELLRRDGTQTMKSQLNFPSPTMRAAAARTLSQLVELRKKNGGTLPTWFTEQILIWETNASAPRLTPGTPIPVPPEGNPSLSAAISSSSASTVTPASTHQSGTETLGVDANPVVSAAPTVGVTESSREKQNTTQHEGEETGGSVRTFPRRERTVKNYRNLTMNNARSSNDDSNGVKKETPSRQKANKTVSPKHRAAPAKLTSHHSLQEDRVPQRKSALGVSSESGDMDNGYNGTTDGVSCTAINNCSTRSASAPVNQYAYDKAERHAGKDSADPSNLCLTVKDVLISNVQVTKFDGDSGEGQFEFTDPCDLTSSDNDSHGMAAKEKLIDDKLEIPLSHSHSVPNPEYENPKVHRSFSALGISKPTAHRTTMTNSRSHQNKASSFSFPYGCAVEEPFDDYFDGNSDTESCYAELPSILDPPDSQVGGPAFDSLSCTKRRLSSPLMTYQPAYGGGIEGDALSSNFSLPPSTKKRRVHRRNDNTSSSGESRFRGVYLTGAGEWKALFRETVVGTFRDETSAARAVDKALVQYSLRRQKKPEDVMRYCNFPSDWAVHVKSLRTAAKEGYAVMESGFDRNSGAPLSYISSEAAYSFLRQPLSDPRPTGSEGKPRRNSGCSGVGVDDDLDIDQASMQYNV
eukprot:gb/GECG01006700.1/.p1 GENE.gb/GECG01006700.1/~~gb/GECG01006700.1/.p1  ORF type:complete len:763 (+),score=94.28 gb/GECG01006700.1/:1-2289(+)